MGRDGKLNHKVAVAMFPKYFGLDDEKVSYGDKKPRKRRHVVFIANDYSFHTFLLFLGVGTV